MSIATILNQINLADVNQTGKVSWTGENGEKSIFTNLTELLRSRGVFYLPALSDGSPNYSGMGGLGSTDTSLLFAEKLGLYVFDSNGANVLPTSVTAVGGLWQLVTPVSAQIAFSFGSNLTTQSITHNLNTATPVVQVFFYPVTGSYPLTETKDFTLTVTSANSISLEFSSSTSSNSLIVVKK